MPSTVKRIVVPFTNPTLKTDYNSLAIDGRKGWQWVESVLAYLRWRSGYSWRPFSDRFNPEHEENVLAIRAVIFAWRSAAVLLLALLVPVAVKAAPRQHVTGTFGGYVAAIDQPRVITFLFQPGALHVAGITIFVQTPSHNCAAQALISAGGTIQAIVNLPDGASGQIAQPDLNIPAGRNLFIFVKPSGASCEQPAQGVNVTVSFSERAP